jgi:hypothetical protein
MQKGDAVVVSGAVRINSYEAGDVARPSPAGGGGSTAA